MKSELKGLVIVLALVGCAKDPGKSVAPAPAASAAALQGGPSATAPPATATVSVGIFYGKELLACTDWGGPPEKIEAFRAKLAGEDGGTVLSQSCDSLGQAALATCKHPSSAEHYYKGDHSDRYMADCVKSGGVWSRNSSDEAEIARTQQELDKLKGKMP
jgi:hypothetical protein